MKKLLTIIFSICSLLVNAQREKAEKYIEQYNEIAIQEMIRTGVPAAIKLAQGILESQSGESDLVIRSNNHFGIKCKPEWTGGRTYHDDDEKGECFRVYPNAEASYKDHSDFLRTRAHYNFLFNLNPADYEAWAYGLKKAGYATSPTYPQKLIKVIKDYQLDKYNSIAIDRQSNGETSNKSIKSIGANNQSLPIAENITSTIDSTTTFSTINDNAVSTESINETIETSQVHNQSNSINTDKASGYPAGVFTINQTKVIFAAEGISLLALANQHGITLSKIMDYNELNNIDILEKDQLIYLEKKQKKGTVDFHIVKSGETIYSIAQTEGIRLENILQYNNNLAANANPTVGNKIYLKPTNTSLVTSNKK